MERDLERPSPVTEEGAQGSGCIACGAPVEDLRCPECGTAQRAGAFRIEKVLARTPHSRVYLARDSAGKAVALKEMLFAQVPDAAALESFEREAQTLRGLDHPAIPRFEASFTEGRGPGLRLYLASGFVEGESLASRLERGRLTPLQALELARQVLRILVYLQQRSPAVLHRDIKPANLMYRPDGSVWLVDFGSSRQLENQATHRSTLVGTFGYMPPEQLGGTVGRSSDVYSLAATVLHALTGKEPQEALGPELTPRLPPGLTPRWSHWLARALAPQPAARFADAQAALDALENESAASGVVSQPRGPIVGVAIGVAVALILPLLWLTSGNKQAKTIASASAANRAAVTQPAVREEHDPDLEALAQIRLPVDADKAQVREYIQRILAVSRNQRTYLRNDPQVGKLTAVGASNAELLVEATDDNVPLGEYPAWALENVATEEHKALILENLRRKHRLATVVLAKGWQREAREILVEGLRGYTGYMPDEWLRALAALRDPTTYEVLTDYLVRGWNRFSTYQILVGLPGLNLDRPLQQAWEQSRGAGTNAWELGYLAAPVLATGYLPALEYAVETLEDNAGVPTTGYNARNLVLRYTEASGSNDELRSWFKSNRRKLRFDPERRKFVAQ